ncbi:hypothetical protein ABTN79_19900, partial [Acinetobacter baumannii]
DLTGSIETFHEQHLDSHHMPLAMGADSVANTMEEPVQGRWKGNSIRVPAVPDAVPASYGQSVFHGKFTTILRDRNRTCHGLSDLGC